MSYVTSDSQQLEGLERYRVRLTELRSQRIAAAEELIRRANADFDRDILIVGRKINELRKQMEASTPPPKAPSHRPTVSNGSHDPEWTQEDIDHYYKLKRGQL